SILEKRIFVKWKFNCLFNEGDYYLNIGVSSYKQHIHRIIDAYSFKILPIENKVFTGNVNIISQFEVCDD
ncbi:MAG: lipopolysaccharide transport system ATP-binding protein, partial [Campylobacterota bacterium]|nr:lipopolysaccharide transport system ATP-binding protein [Campylobacterota bacterium]